MKKQKEKSKYDRNNIIAISIFIIIVILAVTCVIILGIHFDSKERMKDDKLCNKIGYEEMTDKEYLSSEYYKGGKNYLYMIECDDVVLEDYLMYSTHEQDKRCIEYDKWGQCSKHKTGRVSSLWIKNMSTGEEVK